MVRTTAAFRRWPVAIAAAITVSTILEASAGGGAHLRWMLLHGTDTWILAIRVFTVAKATLGMAFQSVVSGMKGQFA
jgi:hypothetical protein